ncbi:MAG: CHAT domain-containing protein [Nitrospirae bacterium]|nr:CHAT domain-containing protein [Magnetococcales bacterium]
MTQDSLIRLLTHESETERLKVLIRDNLAQIDGVFFERLKDRVDPETLVRIARTHMALTHPRPDLLDAFLLLIQADGRDECAKKDRKDKDVLDDEGKEFNRVLASLPTSSHRDLADLVLDHAENAISRLGHMEQGGQFLRIAERLLDRFGFPELRPAFHLQSSSYHLFAEQSAESAWHIDMAYGFQEHFSGPTMAHALEVNRGMVLFRQGHYRQAADHFHTLAGQLEDDPFLQASAISNEAMALGELGLFNQVEKALLAQITKCRSLGDEDHLAKAHGNLANLYGQLGQRRQERLHLRLGLHHARRPGRSSGSVDWHTVNTSLLNLARHHMRAGRLTRAETLLHLFERQAKDAHTDAYRFTRHRLLVELRLEQDRLEEAQSIVTTILHQESERSDYEYISFLGTAGRVFLATGEIGQAVAQFIRALELAHKTDHLELSHGTSAYLGICYEKLGLVDQSLGHISRMFQQDDQLRRNIDNPLHHTYYSARRGGVYDQILAILSNHASVELLFQGIQHIKSRGVSRGRHPAASWDKVLQCLPGDTALLEFSHQKNEGICLLIGHHCPKPQRINLDIGDERLQILSAQLHQAIHIANARPGRDPFLFLEHAYLKLFHPIREYLEPYSALVIAPGSTAIGLPFHLFPLGNGKRVVHRWAVSYAPSASIWVSAISQRHSRNQALAIQAPRASDPPESRQRFALEAERVMAIFRQAGLYPLGATEPSDCPSVTLRDVLAGNRHVDMLHLGFHGRFLENNLLASGLDFQGKSGDHTMGLEELSASSLKADLVFLSGCDTGRVGILGNREPLGLMSLLLGQEIASAVLSHWPVLAGVDITLEVIEAFYRYWLLDGQRKDQALRSAMVTFAKNNPNPYDWGGFSIYGSGF